MTEKTNLTKLVRASMFAALAVGLGYSLMLVPNVELITVVIFLSGLIQFLLHADEVGGLAHVQFSALDIYF